MWVHPPPNGRSSAHAGKGTPTRNIRIDDDLWLLVQQTAEARGTNVSAVVVDRLKRYVRKHAAEREAWLAEQEDDQ